MYPECVAADHGDVIWLARTCHRKKIDRRAIHCRKAIEFWCHWVADDFFVRVVFGDNQNNMAIARDFGLVVFSDGAATENQQSGEEAGDRIIVDLTSSLAGGIWLAGVEE